MKIEKYINIEDTIKLLTILALLFIGLLYEYNDYKQSKENRLHGIEKVK